MNDQGHDLLRGYRPLITHNRKRNTIPAWEQPENHSVHLTLPAQMPPSAQRPLARRDEAAILKSKVEVLIERFKPFAARTREKDRKWMR